MAQVPTTERLLDALEQLADQAALPAADGDWDAFNALIERESAVVEGLAAQADNADGTHEGAAVRSRVAALLNRYEARAQRIAEMAAVTRAELRELLTARRQMRAVHTAYRAR